MTSPKTGSTFGFDPLGTTPYTVGLHGYNHTKLNEYLSKDSGASDTLYYGVSDTICYRNSKTLRKFYILSKRVLVVVGQLKILCVKGDSSAVFAY